MADSLVRDARGNLYGTTSEGGAHNYGTIFKVDATGKETVIHSFTMADGDGASPEAALVRDAQGNLYGTTIWGGAFGYGMLFKVDPTGKETVIHGFGRVAGDGLVPYAGLVRDMEGNLYGTTGAGGAFSSRTVFKIDPAGSETVLYSLRGTAGDGQYPFAGLMMGARGNLYGTTGDGGAYGYGAVFKLTSLPATKTVLSSSPNPSIYGQAVTFTAVVTSKGATPPDGEIITFLKGTTALGIGMLSGGSATCTTSALKAGSTSVTAMYVGDANFAGSKSKPVKQVVEKSGQ